MHPRAVCGDGLIPQYVSGGVLPCGTPLEATFSYDWRNRIALPDSELNTRRFRSVDLAREGIARQVSARHRRFHFPLRAIPAGYVVYAYAYHTTGEMAYVDNLLGLRIRDWDGRHTVDASLFCWQRPILRAEFRYEARNVLGVDVLGTPHEGENEGENRVTYPVAVYRGRVHLDRARLSSVAARA